MFSHVVVANPASQQERDKCSLDLSQTPAIMLRIPSAQEPVHAVAELRLT